MDREQFYIGMEFIPIRKVKYGKTYRDVNEYLKYHRCTFLKVNEIRSNYIVDQHNNYFAFDECILFERLGEI